MTRIAGGGATPVKAPPRVRASPKPRYVAPAPAPKPAPLPKPSYVPTRTSSGANPRGVSVPKSAPKPTKADKAATFTGTGANPRGVRITAPKTGGLTVKQVKHQIAAKAAASHSSGGGFLGLGAITPSSLLHVVTHIPSDVEHGVEAVAHVPIIHNALTDARDFVPTTIEGINTIAQAVAHDALGVVTGATHVGPGAVTQPEVQHSEVKALGENIWKSSITHDVVTGNFKAALHKLVNHPLYGALEFAAGAGVVGRALGAAGRVGVLGEHVAEVAKLARDDRKLIPGTPGLPRHGSKNLIVRVGQHAKDKVELPRAIERRVVNHYVRRDVNHIYGIQGGTASQHAAEIVNEQHAAVRGEKGGAAKVADHTPIIKNFVSHHIPADRRIANDAASAQFMGAVSRKSAIEDIQNLHDSIDEHLNTTKMTKTARKAAETNRDNLANFLKNPDTQAVNEINDSLLARGARQQAEQLDLGLLSKAQAETAPLHGAVVMGHVPGNDIRILASDEKFPSIRKALHGLAKKDVTKALRELRDTKDASAEAKLKSTRAAYMKSRDAERALNQATVAEQRTYGVLLGRHGLNEPLETASSAERAGYLKTLKKAQRRLKDAEQVAKDNKVPTKAEAEAISNASKKLSRVRNSDPSGPGDRLNRYLDKTHAAEQNFKAAKEALLSDKADARETAATHLEAAEANLKDARDHRRALDKYEKEKISGIVENTDVPIRTKKGEPQRYAVRRVPAAEVRRRLISVGRNPDEMGYFNMTPPVSAEEREASTATRGLSRPDAAYHSRTAQGVPKGNYRPGGAGILDSQLQTQRSIDRARGFDFLDRQQSIRENDDPRGELINEDKYGIQKAKEKFEAEHPDIPVTIIPRHAANTVNRVDDFVKSKGDLNINAEDAGGKALVKKSERFGLMPTVAARHYLRHIEADKVGNGAWGAVNRAFRNTVLPLSPKWIAGNDIEGLIRSGLVGAHPGDARIVGKVIKTLRARGDHEQADTIESIMSGQHYAMANRRNHEALVAESLEHPDKQMLLRNRPGIKQLADIYMHGIVEPVFEFNRKIETGFDRAVLGAHMHRQLTEFGANMYQAAKLEQHWIDKLADGYSDPRLVMDAGRFMQKTLGQYSRFGPTAKRLINTIAPFAPWYANALRFVYVTMPLSHPLAQSILLAAGETVQGEYAAQTKAQGNLNDSVFGHRFGALSTALPVKGGGLVDLSRYMPWGAFSGGPINAITSPAGPQIQGPALAMFAGEDPFGSPLKDKNGQVTDKGQEALIGLNEFALSIAGPLDLAYRIVVNHGDTAYSGTTILNPELKPNSHHGGPGILGGVERSMIPLYPTYLNPVTPGSASGTTTGVVGRSGTAVVGRSGSGVVGRSGTTVVGR